MKMTTEEKAAAMTLSTARDILSTIDKGWSPSQIARAKTVANMWAKRRSAKK